MLQNASGNAAFNRPSEFLYSQAVYHFTKLFGRFAITIHFKLTLPSVRIEDSNRVMRNNMTWKEDMAEN